MVQESAQLMLMTDEHVANAISEQLLQKGIHVVRLIDVLAVGTPDPEVIEYCYQHGYALITLDERIRSHFNKRINDGKEHAGVFIGSHALQGTKGIGSIVNFIAYYDEAIKAGAGTVENDVYNRIISMT